MSGSTRMLAAGATAGGLALAGIVSSGAASAGTFTSGAWTLTAPQTDSFSARVEQPINPDGSSVWSAKRGVIPVQFTLTDTTSFVFESLQSGYCSPQPCFNPVNDTAFSFARYVPASSMTVAELTSLVANYTWQTGTDHGGALRWSIETAKGNVHIYFGDYPNFASETPGVNGSGVNLLASSDLRFDTSQIAPGTFYNSYAGMIALVGSQPVIAVDLVVDAGWGGDQVLNLSSATVTDSVNGSSTFNMPGSTTARTTAPSMFIDIVKGSASDPGTVDETTFTGVGDSSGQFAVVNGMYKYNLSTSSLQGPGTYAVYMTPNTDANRINSPGVFVLK